jgi:hypothetical protein
MFLVLVHFTYCSVRSRSVAWRRCSAARERRVLARALLRRAAAGRTASSRPLQVASQAAQDGSTGSARKALTSAATRGDMAPDAMAVEFWGVRLRALARSSTVGEHKWRVVYHGYTSSGEAVAAASHWRRTAAAALARTAASPLPHLGVTAAHAATAVATSRAPLSA